jgi:hypothetical protein
LATEPRCANESAGEVDDRGAGEVADEGAGKLDDPEELARG